MSLRKLSKRVARQRIHDRNLALAQTLAEEQRPEWERVGFREGYRKHQDETTRVLGVPNRRDGADQNAFVLGEQPKDRYVMVALYPRMSLAFAEAMRNGHRYETRPTIARFEPVRKAWTSAEGQLVVWFDYEFRGLS